MNSSDSTTVTALSSADQIKSRILQLQDSLQKQLPGYESLLHIIHTNLQRDPDTVHLLSEQEIGVICSALQKKTGSFIANEAASKSVKKREKIGLADL